MSTGGAPRRRLLYCGDGGESRGGGRCPTARHEQQRTTVLAPPDEVTADRATQFESVAGSELVDEVWRNLAIVETLDRDRDGLLGSGGDRVLPLGAVTVLRGEPHVQVLTRTVAGPVRNVDDDRLHARRLLDDVHDGRDPPAQSPAYRCSRHGSPYRW